LSSNTLDDLLTALKDFDFGIFVFKPDDISIIRNSKVNTVRDNVIFELGLFIGKLGKQRVFFVQPDSIIDFHLPTDLLGMTPGKYNDKREDGNLKAALGPFCNQVRNKLKQFTFISLIDLENETDRIKQIAVEKLDFWEYILASELMKSRLVEINRSYIELQKGLIFKKSKTLDIPEFSDWFSNSATDFERLLSIFKQLFEIELIKAFGEPGVSGNIYEIKSSIDKIASVCKELLAWEVELKGIIPPIELKEAAQLLQGWTKGIIEEINKFPKMIDESFSPQNLAKGGDIRIILNFPPPPNTERIIEMIQEVRLYS